MPYANKARKREYDRRRIVRLRAAEREQRAAEGMAAWREMAEHPTANESMSAEQVRAWVEFVLRLPTIEEACGNLPAPLEDLVASLSDVRALP